MTKNIINHIVAEHAPSLDEKVISFVSTDIRMLLEMEIDNFNDNYLKNPRNSREIGDYVAKLKLVLKVILRPKSTE